MIINHHWHIQVKGLATGLVCIFLMGVVRFTIPAQIAIRIYQKSLHRQHYTYAFLVSDLNVDQEFTVLIPNRDFLIIIRNDLIGTLKV